MSKFIEFNYVRYNIKSISRYYPVDTTDNKWSICIVSNKVSTYIEFDMRSSRDIALSELDSFFRPVRI